MSGWLDTSRGAAQPMLESTDPGLGNTRSLAGACGAAPGALAPLHALLVGGAHAPVELPALPELVAAVLSLASGARNKVMLPLAQTPAEYALWRRGDLVLVDCYGTERIPELFVRNRSVSLAALKDVCARACRALASEASETTGVALRRLAERVANVRVRAAPALSATPVRFSGGSLGSPGADVPLAFGFRAEIAPSADGAPDGGSFADAQALLFEGKLWAFSRDREFALYEGPIMLAAQRMLAAMTSLVDAWQAGRPAYVRLTGDGFAVAVRYARNGDVALTLGTPDGSSFTLASLDVPSAVLPVLRLVSDLSRRLAAADRRQAHNLRLGEIKRQVRALRRVVRAREAMRSFENRDPDRLRLASPAAASALEPAPAEAPRRVRYVARWSAEIDGLDASGLALAGDRLVCATPKLTLALACADGSVLWSRPTARAASLLCGRVLLRALPDGELELCSITDGELFARAHLTQRAPGPLLGVRVGGGSLPPMAVLVDGRERIVAIDLRTGQARWDFRARSAGAFQLRQAGRVLLVVSGDAAIHALDVATGEVAWRFAERVRFCLAPALAGEIVVAAAGEPGGGSGAAYGIELYSGRPLWSKELAAAPSAEPLATGRRVLVGHGRARHARLLALDPLDGSEQWSATDPGLDQGGYVAGPDASLVVNAPSGRLTAIDVESGGRRWTRALSNPLTDDVPRQLTPLLRDGALFVPAAQLHVLSPEDGAPLSSVDCDLVPDFVGVDEHGGCFVAEESGHLRAYAPSARLSLVR